jgi:hypothetical protein
MRTEGRVGWGYGVSVAKIERFEGLIAWQKARNLTREIYPENVLREDPKLLMWHDQAVTRMEGDA